MTITNMKRNIRNGLFKTSLLGVALVAATSWIGQKWKVWS